MYNCKILLDSVNTAGDRLTTFELTYPRFVHCELMTHRVFSRNSSSSRAIPIEKMIEQVENDPVIPVYWGKNQRGMQAGEELSESTKEVAQEIWLMSRNKAIMQARILSAQGVHKQIVNRLLEPWMWITVIVSSTEYNNFFNLRCHKDAQPEMAKIAWMMLEEYKKSMPRLLCDLDWHLPLMPDLYQLFNDKDFPTWLGLVKKVSVGRCARVSYLTHDGKRDPQADIDLHDNRLLHPSNPSDPDHMSPFEHVAMASPGEKSGNFTGWHQYRKDFPNENRTTLREDLRSL